MPEPTTNTRDQEPDATRLLDLFLELPGCCEGCGLIFSGALLLGGVVIGGSLLLGLRGPVSLLPGAGTTMLLLLVWIVLARLSHARASRALFLSSPAGQVFHQNRLSFPQSMSCMGRELIGVVTQQIHLFHASVRDNLTLFDSSISDDHLEQVLAELHLTR